MGMFHYMKFERAEKLSPQKKKKKKSSVSAISNYPNREGNYPNGEGN